MENSFIISDQDETDAIIRSRVFGMEVIVQDNADVPSISSNEDSVRTPNKKKQKTMTDYFKHSK